MPPAIKRRIDLLLVELGLADSRQRAQALLMAGRVTVDGQRAEKPGTLVGTSATVEVKSPPLYVGRGGIKLAHAVETFALEIARTTVLDVGTSTGGFTDCLLQKGAKRVYALDVGHGQIDLRLRRDPRVVVMEGVNARYPFQLPETVDLATVDVSFISLTIVLPSVKEHLAPGSQIIALVKPQFEAMRRLVGKRAVTRDPTAHAAVLARLIVWATQHGLRLRDLTPSPLLGNAGNREFFLLLETERGTRKPS